MISLNETPDAVLTMNDGDEATLDGRTFTFTVMLPPEEVFLTEVGSRIKEYNNDFEDRIPRPEYGDYVKHVRRLDFTAVMTRTMLLEALNAGAYKIE
jgi:hypothetical protein